MKPANVEPVRVDPIMGKVASWQGNDLGFTVNEKRHKLSPPAQLVRWVGLQVYTLTRMISLPVDKSVKGTALIKDMLARADQRKSVTM